MKKIMIAAAIVCAAAFVQAASIDWGVPNNSILMSDGVSKPAKNTLVYLINGDTALDTVAAGVTAGTVTDQAWFYGSAMTSNTKGYIANNTVDGGTKLTAGTEYNFSALLIDGDKYMVSKTYAQNAYTPGVDEATAVSFASTYFGANAQTAALSGAVNGWATAAVPEPTSAMLLVLGVAGLALKRKRA